MIVDLYMLEGYAMTSKAFSRKLILLMLLISTLMTGFEYTMGEETGLPGGYTEIYYSYSDGATEAKCTNAFLYSDTMLYGNAGKLSGDIAKMSVALSMAAYDRDEVEYILKEKMGYTIQDDGSSYNREMTVFDCDHVAYTIASKKVGERVLYCVPVRGTAGNVEWFSNLCNMGASDTHEGFEAAAKEVLAELEYILNKDGVDASNTIVLLTGHSRGAAVANLVAGWMTERKLLPASQIFGYTFACPMVSKSVSKYSNINNFNNNGDLISKIPLPEWNYDSYGKTDGWSFRSDEMAALHFKEDTGSEYCAVDSADGFVSALKVLVPDIQSYYKAEQQLLLHLVANYMSGWKVSMEDMVLHAGYIAHEDILKRIAEETGLLPLIWGLEGVITVYQGFCGWLEEILSSDGMTPEEFSDFLIRNKEGIEEIEAAVGYRVQSMASFALAQTTLAKRIEEVEKIVEIAVAAKELISDADGNPLTNITHGHTQAGYLAAINSRFFGYRGQAGREGAVVTVPESCASIGIECFKDSEIDTVILPDTLRAVGTEAFADLSEMAVALPAGIEYAGDKAFYNCAKMTADDLQKLRQVKERAFYGCPGIKKMTIVHDAETLGTEAFYGCSGLTEVTIPVELSDYDSFDQACSNVEAIHYTMGSTGIMDGMVWFVENTTLEYYSREKLKSIDFESGILEIGSRRFEKCAVLEQADLPDTLVKIDDHAFDGCSALKIVFPETLKNIGGVAFNDCIGIETLIIPKGVEAVGDGAFYGCSGLKELTIPIELSHQYAFDAACSNVNTIHYTKGSTGIMEDRVYFAYQNGIEFHSRRALKNIDFEEGITHIGSYTFGCNENTKGALESVRLPSTLESIGGRAFNSQPALADLMLPDGLIRLDSGCFADCGLTSVAIPDTVESIPENCFAGCTRLKQVSLPARLKQIGECAFLNCESLESLVIPDTVKQISDQALGGCTSLRKLTIPVEVCTNTIANEKTCNVQSIRYTANDSGIMPDRNFNGYYPHSLEYFSRGTLSSVEFAEGVTHIASFAFGLDFDLETEPGVLTEVILPETLQSIGWAAFKGQYSLSELNLPSTVREIGYGCFAETGLSKVVFNGAAPSLGENCFEAVTANAYYPAGANGWEKAIAQSYGGNITWISGEYPVSLSDNMVRLFIIGQDGFGHFARKDFSINVAPAYRDLPLNCTISDPSIVQLADDELAALKEGTAWITVTGGDGYTVRCKVEVEEISAVMMLPASLAMIDESAFESVIKAEMIVLPDTPFVLEERAFNNCEGLKAVFIHSSDAEIKGGAFDGCADITIFCEADSTAESFAKEKKIRYEILP